MANSEQRLPNDLPMRERGQRGHERYAELCALATTGTLTDYEWKQLQSHVLTCVECGAAMQEFREIARSAMPLLLPVSSPEDGKKAEPWTPLKARDELLARVAKGHESGWQEAAEATQQTVIRNTVRPSPRSLYAQTTLRWAAGILLILG